MSHVAIINLTPSRWAEYRQLRLQALETDPTAFARTYKEDAALPDSAWQERLQAAAQESSSYMVFAQSDNKLIGMAAAYIDQGTSVQHRATIIAVYVAPLFRGQGIAKKLLQALIDKLFANPQIVLIKLNVNTNATNALKLYETLGFKKVGLLEKAVYINGVFYDEYLMSLMTHP